MANSEDIAYLSDIVGIVTAPGAVESGNIAQFGLGKTVSDSGTKVSDLATKAELLSEVGDAVSEETGPLWNAVTAVYALQAYGSEDWAESTTYVLGDFCIYSGEGYRCTEQHVSSSSFDYEKFERVLTHAGKLAIDEILSEYSNTGLVSLEWIAPAYSEYYAYKKYDLAIKDGKLQYCTSAGTGPEAGFAYDAALDEAIAGRIGEVYQALDDHASDTDIHVTSAKQAAWDAKQNEISDLDSIRSSASAGAHAALRDMIEIDGDTVTAMHANGEGRVRLARLADLPSSSAAYKIVMQVGQEGQEDSPTDGSPTDESSPVTSYYYEYQIQDRAINYIYVTITDTRTIRLILPPGQTSEQGDVLARDFYVVLYANADHDVAVDMPGASLEDYAGDNVTLVAPATQYATYRFLETAVNNDSTFLVTGFADPAYRKVLEIDRALDDILGDMGYVVHRPSFYIFNEETGLYHKITAVTEGGETNIGVDQTGVDL